MPQARDEAGNIWETDAQGNPVRLIKSADAPPQKGVIYTPPPKQKDAPSGFQYDGSGGMTYVPGGPADPNMPEAPQKGVERKFNQEAKLRDDFNGNIEVKAYRATLPMLAGALKAPKTGQGDLSVIYAYAKAMDPGSVVREGEMDMVSSSSPIVQQYAQKWLNQIDGSGRLPPEARRQLDQELIRITASRRKSYEAQRNRYIQNAQSYGLNPDMVVGPHDGEMFRSDMQAYDKERGLGRFANNRGGNGRNPFEGLPGKAESDTGLYDENGNFAASDPRLVDAYSAFMSDPAKVEAALARKDRLVIANNPNATPEQIQSGTAGWLVTDPATGQSFVARSSDEINEYVGIPRDPYGGNYEQELIGAVKDQTGDATSGQNWLMRAANGNLLGFSDEVNGVKSAIRYGLQGENPVTAYRVGRDLEQMRQNLNEKGQGWQGTALELGASLPTAFALPGSNVNTVGSAARTGAVLGALDGAGRGNGMGGTVLGAIGGATGGAAGGAGGQVLGSKVLAPAIRAGLNTRLGKAMLPNVAAGLPKVTPEESAFATAGADMGKVRANIADAEALGLPYALPDADPRLRMFAGSVSRQSPEAYAMAENYLEPRLLGQNDRAIKAINDHLSPTVDMAERAGAWKTAANAQSSPLYEQAFANNQISWSPRIQQFVDDPLSRSGLAKSMETQRLEALAAGKPFDPTKFSVTGFDEAGSPLLTKTPNLRTIDGIRRGYGEILDAVPKDMRGNPVFSQRDRAVALAKDALTDELDRTTGLAGNSAYADARQTYGNLMRHADALNSGYKAAGGKTLSRDLNREVSGLTPSQIAEYRAGYSTRLRDDIATPTNNVNGYGRVYGGIENPAKVNSLFPEGGPVFARQYAFEREMAKTAKEAIGGSQTRLRQGMDNAVAPQLATAIELAGQGNGVPGAGVVTAKGLNWFAQRGMEKAAKKNAEALAPVLFADTSSINALGLIDAMIANAAKRKAFDSKIGKAASRAGATGGLFGALAIPGINNR